MTTIFLVEYINYLFTPRTDVTSKQLMLIASGKRTPSNLFTAERNDLQGLFNSPINLSNAEWSQCLTKLEEHGLILNINGTYRNTSLGADTKNQFNTDYPFIKKIRSMQYAQTRMEFWNWFVFVNQIVSEYSYKNSRYIPYISDQRKQLIVKKWLSQQLASTQMLPLKWAEELSIYLEEVPDVYRHLILDHFTGHDNEGMTRRQLSQKYECTTLEIDLIILHLMELLNEKASDLPLLGSLWREVHAFCHFGLSESGWRSMKLLDKRHTVEQVARMRHLKENTIKEHILESVLIDPEKNGQEYVPHLIYDTLNTLFEADPSCTFKKAQEQIESLDFFWFRLVQIERIRVNRCQRN